MVKFKEFLVGDLLDGYIGTFISDEFRKEKKDSDFTIPLITSQTTNNGIQAYVKEGEYRELEDCLSISKDGIYAGTVFYQKGKFTLGNVAMGIFAKDMYKEYITKNVYLYLASHIEKIAKSFGGYSKKVGWNIFEYTISLPVTPDGSPDYAYMEDYIKGIQRQYIDNLLETNEAERNRLLSIVGLSLDEYERVKGNVDLVDAENYGEFIVGDLFESINKTNKVFPFSKTSVPDKEHTINATSATISLGNYGYFVKEDEHVLLTDCLSMNSNGGFGLSYYHNDKFAISQDSYAMFSKERINPNVYIYFSTLINKVAANYSYTDKPGWTKIKNEVIKVPTTKTGEVDYQYMEDYISNIKLIYIYTIGNYLLTNK